MFWDKVEERSRAKTLSDRAHLEALRRQQDDHKTRRRQERISDMTDEQDLLDGKKRFVFPTNTSKSNNILNGGGIRPISSYQSENSYRSPANTFDGNYTPSNSNPPKSNLLPEGIPISLNRSKDPVFPSLSQRRGQGDVHERKSADLEPFSAVMSKRLLEVGERESEILGTLQATQEEVMAERRKRKSVEEDLARGKSAIGHLTARIDRMSESAMSDSATIQNLNRRLESLERKDSSALGNLPDLLAQLEREQGRLIATLTEVGARQRVLERDKEEVEEVRKKMTEEISTLKLKLETFDYRTKDIGSELTLRARDLQEEQRHGVEAIRAIHGHEMVLANISGSVESRISVLVRRFEGEISNLERRLESETSAREVLERGTERMAESFRKVCGMQEREIARQLEDARALTYAATEKEGGERTREVNATREVLRRLETERKEGEAEIKEMVREQSLRFEKQMDRERGARKEMSDRTRADTEEGIRSWVHQLNRRYDDQERHLAAHRDAVSLALMRLQESVSLVEKECHVRQKATEDVLRAEIKQRTESITELSSKIDAHCDDEKRNARHMSDRILDRERILQEQLDDMKGTTDERDDRIRKAEEENVDLGLRLGKLTNRVSDSETSFLDRLSVVSHSIERCRRETMISIETCAKTLDDDVDRLKVATASAFLQIQHVDKNLTGFRDDIENKLTTRSVQFDQTLTALKEEFRSRVLRDELLSVQLQLGTEIWDLSRETRDRLAKLEESFNSATVQPEQASGDLKTVVLETPTEPSNDLNVIGDEKVLERSTLVTNIPLQQSPLETEFSELKALTERLRMRVESLPERLVSHDELEERFKTLDGQTKEDFAFCMKECAGLNDQIHLKADDAEVRRLNGVLQKVLIQMEAVQSLMPTKTEEIRNFENKLEDVTERPVMVNEGESASDIDTRADERPEESAPWGIVLERRDIDASEQATGSYQEDFSGGSDIAKNEPTEQSPTTSPDEEQMPLSKQQSLTLSIIIPGSGIFKPAHLGFPRTTAAGTPTSTFGSPVEQTADISVESTDSRQEEERGI